MALIFRFRRVLLAAVFVLLAAIGSRAQAPEFGYWDPSPLPQQGLATFYDPGLMEQVHGYRLAAGDIDTCPECVGSVALLRAGDIGRKVWLQPPGGDSVGPFLVVDCARRQDVQPLLDRNWVVDVSFEVGQYWGMNRPLDGVIVFEDPADAVPGRVLNHIPTPFYVSPDNVVISPPTATPELAPLPSDLPTSWPTRQPVPLVPLVSPPEVVPPANTPPPATPTAIWPPPLTPIVTTPTPAIPPEQLALTVLTPESAPDVAQVGSSPTPTPIPTEVVLGRAGGGLLETLEETTAPAEPSLVTPTARPTLARTPRPNLTPILAVPTANTTPSPALDPNPLDRFLRGLIDLVR